MNRVVTGERRGEGVAMKAMRRKGGWRGLAAGLAGGLLLLLIGDRGAHTAPPTGLGIDPFEVLDLQVKNNVLIVLDTSGSMEWPTNIDDFEVGGDDPSSRFFQLKEAVRGVVNANATRVNFGLATYNIASSAKQIGGGPFTYVSADGNARAFYDVLGQGGCGGGTDGYFCQVSGTFTNYDQNISDDVFRSFDNNGNSFDDPYPAGCTPDAGQLTPVDPQLGAAMRCRYYIQSRLIRRNVSYTWDRNATTNATRMTAINTNITCPPPPAGLLGYVSNPPICFQFIDTRRGGTIANQTSTFYYTSATWDVTTGNNCGGGALLNQVAPCAGNNAPAILSAVDPSIPITATGAFQGAPIWPPPIQYQGTPAQPDPWDYDDGHLERVGTPGIGDNLPVAGLRPGQSTPMAGTLDFVGGLGAPVPPFSFPPQAVPGQKNFVILLTDGDDTCADPSNLNRSAALTAEAAARLYANGNFQRQAETLVVAFASALTPARVNVMAWGGSGGQIITGQSTPAAATGTQCFNPNGCRPTAFFASNTQQLVSVLQAAIDQATVAGVFSATASVFDGVQEYSNRFSPRHAQTTTFPGDGDPFNPDTRYTHAGAEADRDPGALVAYRALFNASGFRGIVKAFSAAGPVPVPDLENLGSSRDWEAGQTLIDRISDDLKVRCTAPRPVDCDADFVPQPFATIVATNKLNRRIFTSSGNGVAPQRVNLWPPDPLVAPTVLTPGQLDFTLFRKFDGTQLTQAEMQAAPFGACQGAPIPVGHACLTSLAAQVRKETREMILAYLAGAEVRRQTGNPIRAANGDILYQARTWVLAESTLAQPAVVTPPFHTDPGEHVNEYILYRDGPRLNGVSVANNPVDRGFGLRHPDLDQSNGASAGNPDLKPVMTVLYVPSNDMLHAFRGGPNCNEGPTPPAVTGCPEGGGQELWGYVPYDVLFKVKDLLRQQTRIDHTFMMGSSLRFAEVFVPGQFVEQGITYSGRWRRVLIAGRGIGGKYYSALDITAPGPFTRSALQTNLPTILWNRGNPDTNNGLAPPLGARNGTGSEFADYGRMGQTWSTPLISRVPAADNAGREHVVYVGSGYGVNHDPVNRRYDPVAGEGTLFYTLDPLTGSILSAFDVGSAGGAFPNVPNALLANPVHFAPGRISITQQHPAGAEQWAVYSGDLHGRMWKVDTRASGTPIQFFDAGVAQPIATAAALLKLDTQAARPHGARVFFETGYDQRVVPGAQFQMWGLDDAAVPPTVINNFPIAFPGASAGKGPYRGTLQPVTTVSVSNAAAFDNHVFFAGTRFNPITGTSCSSTFDTIIFDVGVGPTGGGVATEEHLLVKAVGLQQPPTDASKIDHGVPTTAGVEPHTPLPPNRIAAPGGGGAGNAISSMILRTTSPVCREN